MAHTLGLLAGLLQALGYGFYFYLSLYRGVRPNSSTWFMFAYGVGLLWLLEWEQGAGWELQVLPAVCAILSVAIAFTCWKRGGFTWPDNRQDQFSFIVDLALTAGYAGAWVLEEAGVLSDGQVGYAVFAFLLCSNLTTFTSFEPLIHEAAGDPKHERWEPWAIWALAYAVLGVATFLQHGLWTEFMLYPAINAPLHAVVAWLARPARQRRYQNHCRLASLS